MSGTGVGRGLSTRTVRKIEAPRPLKSPLNDAKNKTPLSSLVLPAKAIDSSKKSFEHPIASTDYMDLLLFTPFSRKTAAAHGCCGYRHYERRRPIIETRESGFINRQYN